MGDTFVRLSDVMLFRMIERLIVVLCVPLLLWIGYKLFVLGATGVMTLSAKGNSVQGKLTNISPGSFCLLLACAVTYVALNSNVKVDYSVPPSQSPNSGSTGNEGKSLGTEGLKSNGAGATQSPSKGNPSGAHILFEGAGGQGQGELTSITIRRVLSDWAICAHSTSNMNQCDAALSSKLWRIPSTADIANLERLESLPPTAETTGLIRGLRKDFIKVN